jgi:NitT/TauT family transport system substrate-binding protein
MRRSDALRGFAAGIAAASVPLAARAADAGKPMTLALTGRTASAWPTYVATELGFFTANGLAIDIVTAGSSASGTQQLAAGSADVADVSATQIVQAVIGGAPIKAVFDRSRSAPYYLFGKKGITSLAQLKGKTIIIGGVNDITRIFTDTILRNAKVDPADVTYVYAGGAAERYAALLSGGVDASILNAPFMFRAQEQGFPVLADILKTFPQFPFVLYAANVNWAKAQSDTLMAFIKANIQATMWMYDPKNKDRCIDILAKTTNSPAEDAAKTYAYYIEGIKFFLVNGTATAAKIQLAIDADVSFKLVNPPTPAATSFYDNTYVAAANAQLRVR